MFESDVSFSIDCRNSIIANNTSTNATAKKTTTNRENIRAYNKSSSKDIITLYNNRDDDDAVVDIRVDVVVVVSMIRIDSSNYVLMSIQLMILNSYHLSYEMLTDRRRKLFDDDDDDNDGRDRDVVMFRLVESNLQMTLLVIANRLELAIVRLHAQLANAGQRSDSITLASSKLENNVCDDKILK